MTEPSREGNDTARAQLALLRDSAGKFADGNIHVRRARQLRGTQPGHDPRVWREMADMGWLGILMPESLGGMGLGCAEMAIVAEALGKSLFPEPLAGAVVFAGGALRHGDNVALQQALLPKMMAGQLIPAMAWREHDHAGELLAVETLAEVTADGAVLSGTKRMIIGGAAADGFVVTARSAQGLCLYWVPRTAAGDITTVELADGRLAAEIHLSRIKVPGTYCIAGPGVAESALLRAYDETLVVTAAEMLGVMARAFEITLEYLRTRKQFGKFIGSFQALQHRAVDLYGEQRICRHALDDVIRAVSDPDVSLRDRGAQASRIKARCAAAGLRVTREAVQMHGAIGFSDECDIGMYLKRAIVLAGWLGGAEFHRRRFARLSPHEAT